MKARFSAHAGLLETHALRLALQWVGRSASHVGQRVVSLIDARSVLGAAAKGRTSAKTLKKQIRMVSALALALDITLNLVYIPSCHNPADHPSRGRAILYRKGLVRRHGLKRSP